jgi:hypothetical protein
MQLDSPDKKLDNFPQPKSLKRYLTIAGERVYEFSRWMWLENVMQDTRQWLRRCGRNKRIRTRKLCRG